MPNKQVQDYELEPREGGASNVTAVGGDMALGKTAQGKVDERSARYLCGADEVERIGKDIRRNGPPTPEAGRDGIRHSGKAWRGN